MLTGLTKIERNIGERRVQFPARWVLRARKNILVVSASEYPFRLRACSSPDAEGLNQRGNVVDAGLRRKIGLDQIQAVGKNVHVTVVETGNDSLSAKIDPFSAAACHRFNILELAAGEN